MLATPLPFHHWANCFPLRVVSTVGLIFLFYFAAPAAVLLFAIFMSIFWLPKVSRPSASSDRLVDPSPRPFVLDVRSSFLRYQEVLAQIKPCGYGCGRETSFLIPLSLIAGVLPSFPSSFPSHRNDSLLLCPAPCMTLSVAFQSSVLFKLTLLPPQIFVHPPFREIG